MRLVLSDYEAATLAEVEQALRADGAEVHAVQADIARQADVDALARSAIDRFGAVDMVCNTVGVSAGQGPAWEAIDDDWRWVFAVNVWGAIHVMPSFVPHLVACGAGYLLSTSSTTAVLAPLPNSAVYLSSKHAVVGLSEGLQRDLQVAGSAVKVSVAFPGTVRSQIATGHRNRQPEFGPAHMDEARVARARQHLETEGTSGDVLAERMIERMLAGDFYLFGRPQDVPYVTERAAGVVGGYLADQPPIGFLAERPPVGFGSGRL